MSFTDLDHFNFCHSLFLPFLARTIMPEAFTNNQENPVDPDNDVTLDAASGDRSREARELSASRIPKRRGSKYADILLQRLQHSLLSHLDAAVIGMIGLGPSQGVTTMAINFAIRAADHGYCPALVIDCNHTNQKLSRLYRCTGAGIGECLYGDAALESSVKKTRFPDLKVLGAGQAKLGRQVVVDGEIIGSFFKLVRNDYRLTVLDLPSTIEPSLADSLLAHLDGILIVARYGSRREQLTHLQESIRRRGGKALGVVMTGDEQRLPRWVPRLFS